MVIEKAKSFPVPPLSKGDVELKMMFGLEWIVPKDVEPYSIVAGNPARHIRYRFNKEIIDDLQSIGWWDWPLFKIEEAWPLLISSDIELFMAKYKTRKQSA